ncbi:MAG: winged helix-turn-helix transcriptional regulator [Gammaproteobacteria bacterium]|nr:winged helix-turn-helix transcriptional regulator [Gammaproteobacteria bacterium]MYH84717.1 winged helix-turn-helix transcriptional regulator [Gammaproteobacteria bacterium]MYK06099.1 winged helix-turn-helix transcriptional regulator [Gammaproteobacteria bacterium]
MELIELLKRPEDKTLEFKRDLSSPSGILRSIVAFANSAGGVLLLGVEDDTRNVRGIEKPLEMEERMANLISDGICPRLIPDIEILPWRCKNVLAVRVHPSPGRPHYLKNAGLQGGAYVRVGSTNRRADRELIDELRRFTRGETFDEQAMLDCDSEALDFKAASESFASVRGLKQSDLDTLRLMTTHQGRKVPTVGGMLLFGIERDRYFPDAWIQAGRFRGTDKADIIDTLEIRSLPVRSVEDAVAFVQKHALRGMEIGAVHREERWNLPPAAVREAIVNAIVHADYSQRGAPIRVSIFDDRLEVESPGLLPFGLTVDDLLQGVSKLRNRVIGRVFHELGLIEQWGSGIQRIVAVCRDAGLAPPVLEEIGTHFRATIRTSSIAAPSVDEKDQTILDALAAGDGLSTQEVASVIGLTARATRSRLLKLIERGLVVEIGISPQDPKRRYFKAE